MKVRLLIMIICTYTFIFKAVAQDSQWQLSTDIDFKMSLSTFTNNWSGNYAGTFVWLSDFNVSAQKDISKWFNNEEDLKLSFGQTKVQDKTTKNWSLPQKSEDNIDFQSINKFSLGKKINPCLVIEAITQFYDIYEGTDKKCYLNPLELTESFGFTREFGKKDKLYLNARLSAAARQDINRHCPVLDDSTEIVSYQREITKDGGLELTSEFRWKKINRFNIYSNFGLFKSLIRSNPENPPENEYWKYPDLKWETNISINATSFLQFTYYFLLNYDREADKNYRFKQTLGIGLTFSFSNG
jgi:hypothetical protein